MKFDVTLRKELKGGFTLEFADATDALVSVETSGIVCAIKIFETMVEIARAIRIATEEDKS